MARTVCMAWWIASLLLLAGVGARPAYAASPTPQGDHLGTHCAACHLAGEAVTAENAKRLKGTQERLCGTCHRGAVQASHPTGFVPGRTLPARMPLDWKGEMTCSTCHDVHGRGGGSGGAGAAAASDLGGGGELCASCHPRSFFAGMADRGESLLRSAHLDARASRPVQDIDGYSQRCLDCHADRLSLPGAVIRAAFTARNGSGMVNHPIGMRYAYADLERDLRSPATLPAAILLPDGQVSCLSCHDGYSARHGALVTVGSTDMCLACHDK